MKEIREILDKKTIIKDCKYPKTALFISFVALFVLSFECCSLKTQSNIPLVLSIEQSLFIILAAVIVVFNESVISYKNISQLRNKINKLKQNENKTNILNWMGESEHGNSYDEFLTELDGYHVDFAKKSDKFKSRSYKLYIIFSMIGLFVIVFSLINFNNITNFLINEGIENKYIQMLLPTKYHIVNACIYTQIVLIIIWAISALQSELQKRRMIEYVEIKNIKKHIEQYINDNLEKKIEHNLEKKVS